jgi:Asp/Glu/hydantoin racemase
MKIWFQSFTDPIVDRAYFERLEAFVREVASPECKIDVRGMCPGDHQFHVVSELRCSLASLRAALQAEREGYDAFIVGHFQEPGLDVMRSAVDIPVIGLGESSMLHACTLGKTVGLVTINPIFVPFHRQQILAAGLQGRITAVRAVRAEVHDYVRAFQDPALRARMFEAFVREAQLLVDDGIEVVVPAGGLPMVLFAKELAESGIGSGNPGSTGGSAVTSLRSGAALMKGATLMNGLPVAIEAAQSAVRLRRRFGINTSRAGTYALANKQTLDELMACLASEPGVI